MQKHGSVIDTAVGFINYDLHNCYAVKLITKEHLTTNEHLIFKHELISYSDKA